ncbi:LOW QUALITY PROTEIN: hypothetical protein LZ30DRAFT_751254 [Colletotrichum cereale]|nr:LOW QUALITY PROTEIN: hypothetical protein LZ30DRAFT_751254 [Colletotrichum cereale]
MISPKKTIPILTETLLGAVLSKAADAISPSLNLGDNWAAEILTNVDHDFSRLGVSDIHAHSPNDATMVHLAWGLDTRALRLRRYFSRMPLRWIDVDLPYQMFEDSTHELRASSATDPGWYRDIPADRPTMVVIKGLSVYLVEEEMRGLVRGLGWLSPVAKSLDRWLDKPLSVEAWAEGLTLREELLISGLPLVKESLWKIRLQYAIAASLPWVYHFHRMMRSSF